MFASPLAPLSACVQPKCLLSKFLPRSTRIQERYQVMLSCQIDEVLINLALKSDDIQLVRQTESLGLKMVLQITVLHVIYHLPGGLGHFAENKCIPQNQPIIFYPSLIATVPQTSHLLFCVPLFQVCHSSRIDRVLKFSDSKIGSRNFRKLLSVS